MKLHELEVCGSSFTRPAHGGTSFARNFGFKLLSSNFVDIHGLESRGITLAK